VTSLLKKQNLQECYYWTFELYYSGFDNEVVQLLWKIYWFGIFVIKFVTI
jgi:hypothetical protein